MKFIIGVRNIHLTTATNLRVLKSWEVQVSKYLTTFYFMNFHQLEGFASI